VTTRVASSSIRAKPTIVNRQATLDLGEQGLKGLALPAAHDFREGWEDVEPIDGLEHLPEERLRERVLLEGSARDIGMSRP